MKSFKLIRNINYNVMILISGHLLHKDAQQRIKYSHFLITLEVNISETVADSSIVTISYRNSFMNFHFTW